MPDYQIGDEAFPIEGTISWGNILPQVVRWEQRRVSDGVVMAETQMIYSAAAGDYEAVQIAETGNAEYGIRASVESAAAAYTILPAS